MKEIYIDINCDVGEGMDNENGLFPLISSCNIACGGHAGDADSMLRITKLAKEYSVYAGAHPSYPDLENFGRVSLKIEPNKLAKSIQSQINSLVVILKKEELALHHIKPHGALYNDLVKNKNLALIFLNAIEEYKDVAILYAPHESFLAEEALGRGFNLMYEAFADRNYNFDLSLVSRKMPNALIEEPQYVLNHLVRMVKDHTIKTIDGTLARIVADTYCLHGDTPNALQILMYLSRELPKQNIYIKK
jgi:UPF0271 protein